MNIMDSRNIFLAILISLSFALADDSTSSKPSSCSDALTKRFEEWKAKFQITYPNPEEEELRREIFCSNARKVQSGNARNASYTRAENAHSDKSTEEKNENMLGAKKPPGKVGQRRATTTLPPKVKGRKRTKTTRTKRPKTVKNRITTVGTTKRTTFPWTTKSRPTTRPPLITTRSVATTRRPTTSTTSTSTTRSTTTLRTTTRGVSQPELINYSVNNAAVPNSLNYTSDCTPAKDQYGCGACWAFAAVAVTEYWRNKAKMYSNLSEQDILDCNTFGDDCNGGWPTNAFSFMVNPGNSDAKSYPYKSQRGDCMQKQFPPIVRISKACEVELNGNETLLKELVSKHGPISVVIYVENVMYSYSSGIFFEPNCPSQYYNHAVTVVGYGSLASGDPKDYWIIKNSWGTSWGNNGYGLMARNKNNHCAIATYAMYPC